MLGNSRSDVDSALEVSEPLLLVPSASTSTSTCTVRALVTAGLARGRRRRRLRRRRGRLPGALVRGWCGLLLDVKAYWHEINLHRADVNSRTIVPLFDLLLSDSAWNAALDSRYCSVTLVNVARYSSIACFNMTCSGVPVFPPAMARERPTGTPQ